MNVYVVIEDGHVFGAATDFTGAYRIADRKDETWTAWEQHDGGDSWSRWRWRAEAFRRSIQQLVMVPLAGMPEPEVPAGMWNGSHDPIEDMRAARGDQLARLGYAQEVEEIGRMFGAP